MSSHAAETVKACPLASSGQISCKQVRQVSLLILHVKKNMVLISSDMLLISLSGSGRRTIKYGNEHNSVLCSWSFAMTNISQDNTRKSLLMSADSEEDVKQPSKDHYTQTTAIP